MADRYVDDGGDNTDGLSWATAYTSFKALMDAEASFLTTSGNRVFIGHDHVCPRPWSASVTITFPTSGDAVQLISATTGSDPVEYQKSSSAQIDLSNGSYTLTLNGAHALYGVKLVAGSHIQLDPDLNENFALFDATLAPGPNGQVIIGTSSGPALLNANLTIDLSQDGTTNRSNFVLRPSYHGYLAEIKGLTFVNAAYRTGNIIGTTSQGPMEISGADFSGFTNASTCELVQILYSRRPSVLTNCKTATTWAPTVGTPDRASEVSMYNVGPEDAPTYLFVENYRGKLISSSAISRTDGATVEDVATSWLVITDGYNCSENEPFLTPWIYGTCSAGSKTFTVHITNDTADFTDAQVWLEIQYLATDGSGLWTLASDHRATIVTTAANQTDDTASTWTGTGPAFTYKQALAVTATVGEAGQYRARVCVGLDGIASSRYFYIDPLVVVS